MRAPCQTYISKKCLWHNRDYPYLWT